MSALSFWELIACRAVEAKQRVAGGVDGKQLESVEVEEVGGKEKVHRQEGAARRRAAQHLFGRTSLRWVAGAVAALEYDRR